MNRHGFLLVGVALSAVLLAWTLHGLHLEEWTRALSGLKIPWLLIGALFYFVAVILRTWRWGILLHSLQSTGFRDRFIALTIGYMGNNLYPARAGELLRAYVLQRRCGIRVSTALGTIVVERVLDGLMVVFLALVALLFFPLPASLRSAVMAGGVVFGGALLMLLGMARNAAKLHDLLERISRHRLGLRMERAMAFLSRFLDGLTVLQRPAHALAVGGLTALIWLAEAGTYSLVMQAFPFRASFFSLLVMTATVNLATALPSAPGYVGTFEAPGIVVLRAFGIPAGAAFAYTLFLHLVLWLPITLLGLFLFLREGLRGMEKPADVSTSS
ncbi:lysylphosphatidylglycerol synthase transmembrane domain-containing protein [Thermoflexus sp.]|uniref:lysylphosphatidylglycerol synthase transmembrane domain-containing protein n=1 Tax=Thermoflexus sp. TaxID=1969742 RepID=UPI002ADE68EF|nr:lysylphosphatidylglycerol synthase transmembrane domain-containing protein [Thermoflexus sp.]